MSNYATPLLSPGAIMYVNVAAASGTAMFVTKHAALSGRLLFLSKSSSLRYMIEANLEARQRITFDTGTDWNFKRWCWYP
jgi:hypothetical protein